MSVPDKIFTTSLDAIKFLKKSLEHDDGVPLDITETGINECSAEFDVTPIPEDPEQVAIPKTFVVNMDNAAPTVSCGFSGESSVTADGKTLLLWEDASAGVVQTNFVYNVEDNCASVAVVDVQVSNNEFDEKRSVFLAELTSLQGLGQADLFVAATSCRSETRASSGSFCHSPLGAQNRVYEIVVSATDAAGLVETATCHVVVIPGTNQTLDLPGKNSVRGAGDDAMMKEIVAKAASAKKYKVGSLSLASEI